MAFLKLHQVLFPLKHAIVACPNCSIVRPCQTCVATAELLRIVRKPRLFAFLSFTGARK